MVYRTILVFAAHPDDEMTMAGTISKIRDLGVGVVVVQCTNGSEGYPSADMAGDIVRVRRVEADAADAVLGTSRIHLGHDDMALTNDKPTFLEFIEVIRRVRPDAIFTHGPDDLHRDHLATHQLSVEARWQAGQPVSTRLGKPWQAAHTYYYKGVREASPDFEVDVSGYAHKAAEARKTQVSQHVLFRRTVEDFEREIAQLRSQAQPRFDRYWDADRRLGFAQGRGDVQRPDWLLVRHNT